MGVPPLPNPGCASGKAYKVLPPPESLGWLRHCQLLFLLYINDLPSASQFNTTLFADDTLLMLADKNSDILKTKVNEQIQPVDYRLRKNKLSLNYSKANLLLINKHPQKKVDENLVIRLNEKFLERSSAVNS